MSTPAPRPNIAIIGAGLSGLSLALALSKKSIPCTIYESRNESYNQGGAIMLSPNALRILDRLGVYSKIQPQGFNFEMLTFTKSDGEVTDRYYFGHEGMYGYKGLRIYRQVLIDTLVGMLRDLGVPMFFNRKFKSIDSEGGDGGVVMEFADGSRENATLVVGADGIHSKVRNYVEPSITPQFMGLVALTTSIQKSVLRLPEGKELPLPISISCSPGVFVMAPQDPKGEELFVGTQFATTDRDRAGWEAFVNDKDSLVDMMRSRKDEWPEIVQSALDGIEKEKMTTWPFYAVPSLERWFSEDGKVVLVGDAAHAIPPTSGQGVNQAFEDVYTFASLVSQSQETGLNGKVWQQSVQEWQAGRQRRIDEILDLTRRMNNKRLPLSQQALLDAGEIWHGEEGEAAIKEMEWLYGADLDGKVFA